jgi:hypothetical protein
MVRDVVRNMMAMRAAVRMANVSDVMSVMSAAVAMAVRTVAGMTVASESTHCHRAEANCPECETD